MLGLLFCPIRISTTYGTWTRETPRSSMSFRHKKPLKGIRTTIPTQPSFQMNLSRRISWSCPNTPTTLRTPNTSTHPHERTSSVRTSWFSWDPINFKRFNPFKGVSKMVTTDSFLKCPREQGRPAWRLQSLSCFFERATPTGSCSWWTELNLRNKRTSPSIKSSKPIIPVWFGKRTRRMDESTYCRFDHSILHGQESIQKDFQTQWFWFGH